MIIDCEALVNETRFATRFGRLSSSGVGTCWTNEGLIPETSVCTSGPHPGVSI